MYLCVCVFLDVRVRARAAHAVFIIRLPPSIFVIFVPFSLVLYLLPLLLLSAVRFVCIFEGLFADAVLALACCWVVRM